eukprot:TRINITY_DN2766_c0_g2_i1.p1 TRINITY_DN2766_c0_g2~~TRINITY_DN2766_c0_g2_i1.p1  ORF type:complete len:1341 (-),score=383.37 TRINITY_DN2766_c0_g2_i1:91-4113(-)
MDETDEAANDERELGLVEQKVLEAYKTRGSNSGFSKHPLQKLEQFFHECNIEQLERRCRLVATHNLHLPTLAWVPDTNIRLHSSALHILAEITNFSSKDYNGGVDCAWADEVCKSITTLGGVRPILDKLDPRGEEVATRYAATILTNLAMYSEQTSRIITKDPAVSNAVAVIRHHKQEDDDDLPIACAQLLVALSSNEENCVDLCFTRTLLDDLVACMSIQVSEVQKNIYETLANLSLNSYMKNRMGTAPESGDSTVVQTVVRELNKGNSLRDDMLVPLVRLVANVTVDVNSHEDLVAKRPVQQDSDGKGQSEAWKSFLENVVRLLSNTQSPALQLQLVRLLRNLAATQNCRERIVQYGAAAPLFQVIRDTDIQDKQVHYWAAAAIASIARQPKLHPRLMQEKGLRPLVAFAGLQNSGKDGCDLRTRLYAAKTLAELAKNDDNKSAIIQEGGLVPLIVWARGFGNIEVQQAACEALSRLGVDASLLESKEDQTEQNSPDADDEQANIGIPEMVQLAESNFIEVQLFAAGELANIALNHESICDVIQAHGLDPLLKLAESPNETVQAQATRALLNLSSGDDGLDIAHYTRLLEARKEELNRTAKAQSRRLKDDKVAEYEFKIKLKQDKIQTYCDRLQKLHKLVHTSSMYVQRNVAATIANLAIYPDVQAAMLLLETAGEGGIFNLIQMLHSSSSLDMKVHAARALFNLSVSDTCREKIVELRGVKICFDLLSHKNVQIKRLVVGIIAHIASSAAMRIELAGKSIDGLERLISLATETHVSIVQEQLARALAMLALNDDNKRKIVQLGGSKIIIRWAGSTRIGVQIQAAKALCNLLEDKHSSNDAVRYSIFSEGALQVLFMLAQVGDSQTKLQVIRIMRSLRTYKNGSKWDLIFNFFKEGGITPLCHLVTNPPPGDLRLRVKADAAQELIKLLHSVEKDITELLEKVIPCLVPLLVLQPPGDDLQQSTPEMRRSALGLFDKLVRIESYKSLICKMLSQDYIADELIRLRAKVTEARSIAKRNSKLSNSTAAVDPMDQVSDFDPLDEEVSKYVINLVEHLRLAKMTDKFNTSRDYQEDDEGADADKHLDEATRARLAEGQMAAQNQENVESAYVQMQTQLQKIEADQLMSSGGATEKKVFKVVVVGDAGVGKSSIIYRYTQQKPPPPVPKATLGCEYTSKRVERPGVTVLLQLFDIQGLENFRKAAPRAFFANAHGCIVVFDVASKATASFFGAQEWKKTVDMHFEENHRKGAPAILIANKSDLPNSEKNPFVRSASKMERSIAEHGFISWHNTSAKDGKMLKTAGGAVTAFDSLIDSLLLWERQGKFVELSLIHISEPTRPY